MYKLVVVTDPVNGAGFRLSGFDVVETSVERVKADLLNLMTQKDVGIVAINEDLMRSLDEITARQVEASDVPLVVPFPAFRSWEIPKVGEGYIAQLIRRAIGYHIKLARG